MSMKCDQKFVFLSNMQSVKSSNDIKLDKDLDSTKTIQDFED